MALDRGPEMGSGVERLNKTIFFLNGKQIQLILFNKHACTFIKTGQATLDPTSYFTRSRGLIQDGGSEQSVRC